MPLASSAFAFPASALPAAQAVVAAATTFEVAHPRVAGLARDAVVEAARAFRKPPYARGNLTELAYYLYSGETKMNEGRLTCAGISSEWSRAGDGRIDFWVMEPKWGIELLRGNQPQVDQRRPSQWLAHHNDSSNTPSKLATPVKTKPSSATASARKRRSYSANTPPFADRFASATPSNLDVKGKRRASAVSTASKDVPSVSVVPSVSTEAKGKRSFSQLGEASPTDSKRFKRNAMDGEKLAWPVVKDEWNDRADGSIDMSTLSTPSGGDFNSSFNAHYWSPEKGTAEQEWGARRCRGSAHS
ncbi:hypothetical protein CFD26_100632 [Aspergillus turcosus]|uniref:Uncharacterized protein n=1 Tax=Aspergillus turcosus TaxID=1245748 RepID=A0A3R7IE37_9EURO|nr:hypothetical protein CFD26_100632 [Aspergillus turcosus]